MPAQALFESTLQEQVDTFDLLRNDLKSTVSDYPLAEVAAMIAENPADTAAAEAFLMQWYEENSVPAINDALEQAQKQAIDTAARMAASMGVG